MGFRSVHSDINILCKVKAYPGLCINVMLIIGFCRHFKLVLCFKCTHSAKKLGTELLEKKAVLRCDI